MQDDDYSAEGFLQTVEGDPLTRPPTTWKEAQTQWMVKREEAQAQWILEGNKGDAPGGVVPLSEMVEFFNPVDFGMAVLLAIVVFLGVRRGFRRFHPGFFGLFFTGLLGGGLLLMVGQAAESVYFGWTAFSVALLMLVFIAMVVLAIPVGLGRAFVNSHVEGEIRLRRLIREARREWDNTSGEPRFTGIFTGGKSGKSRSRRDR